MRHPRPINCRPAGVSETFRARLLSRDATPEADPETKAPMAKDATAHPSWFEASLYSPAAKYLTNDGSFAQSQQPSPWRIEFIDGAPRNGGSIRLQAAD